MQIYLLFTLNENVFKEFLIMRLLDLGADGWWEGQVGGVLKCACDLLMKPLGFWVVLLGFWYIF